VLAKTEGQWEFATMKTLTVDDQKRIKIPDAKPRQVFSFWLGHQFDGLRFRNCGNIINSVDNYGKNHG
jgi:hypothetical protein